MIIYLSKIKLTARGVTLWAALLAGGSFVPLAWAAVSDGAGLIAAPLEQDDSEQVAFSANTVSYDETGQIITAEGQVEIAQAGKIIRATKVTYNLLADKVTAEGDVVFLEPTGDIHFAERAEFERKLKNGYIKKLRSVLADGSRFSAAEGHRIAGKKTEMKQASYTPCEPCKANPEKAPLWQLVADKVTLDEVDHSVSYDNARLEVYGVPVAYTPYFMHPDGTVKQKSGVLPPRFSLSSQLGFGVMGSYYYAIDPSQDATLGARIFSKENPMLLGEYRRLYKDAKLDLKGSIIQSNDDDRLRGHLFGNGIWDIDQNWRAGIHTQITSDDKYLRHFDFSSDGVLENEIYAERFADRDYFVTRAVAFQDVRVSNRSTDQPNILPEAQASFMGDPNSLLGGRWDADMSVLDIVRKGNGQDVLRLSGSAGWERRDVSAFGLVNKVRLTAATASYQISDRDEVSIVGGSGGSQAFRFYPMMHDELSFPLSQDFETTQWVIEPKVSLTASPRIKNDTDIPNEDSQDVQIDALNIFNDNRYPGIDRVEDKTHVTYGVRTGIYADDGSIGEVFLGQSRRLDNGKNTFPTGSGLSEQSSDVVGEVISRYKDIFTINYKTQLNSESFTSERHELDGSLVLGDFTFSGNYLYLRGLEGTDLISSRQQIYSSIAYMPTEDWKISTAARYDFSDAQEGMRYADLGLDYLGQCASLGIKARRSFIFSNTGENATEIVMQVGLKNLGTFGTNN